MGRLNSKLFQKSSDGPLFRFTPHSDKQSELIESDSIETIAATGTQWGKSSAGSLWMLRKLHQFTDTHDNFLIMAPTYKIMEQSMLPYFLNAVRYMGEYFSTDGAFRINDGRLIYFRTERDPDSIVGIPRVRAYWLDEAGKVSLYFHENIKARAASIGAKGLYTTSPYTRNWLYTDYIKPNLVDGVPKAATPNLKLLHAASWENPYHSLANLENRKKMRASMDERRFDMLFGGEWGQHSGLVYNCFDEVENVCDALRLPNGTQFYAGVDWGHTEPFVIVVRAVTPDGYHYQVSEFHKTGMTILEQMKVAAAKKATYGIKHFYCGHERPENILIFNQNGLPAVPVPEKEIQVGTDLHYELIKTRRYKVFAGTSPHTINEYFSYHYPEPQDLKPDEEACDQTPVGQDDHCMSANRFVTLRTYRSTLKIKPFTPAENNGTRQETQSQRLKRLMTSKTREKFSSENWS